MYRLHRIESFELGRPQVDILTTARARMRLAKGFRLGPVLEVFTRLPNRVRGVERVIRGVRPAQQIELDKPRNLIEVRIALGPDALEHGFLPLGDAEAVHCDIHGLTLSALICSSAGRGTVGGR